jgi:hypothetical protein
MSLQIRACGLIALICVAAGCSDAEGDRLKAESLATTEELRAAQAEITKLKAELLETTKWLHETQAKTRDSETKLFAAVKGKREAEAQVVEITAEKVQLSEQLEELAKAKRSAKAQPAKSPGQ